MVEELIKRIARQLDKAGIAYMVIGGQAMLLYGRVRATLDIDITIGVDVDKYSAVEQVCKKAKLRILPDEPEKFAQQTRVIPAEDPKTKIRADMIFSFSEYEAEAIKRAKKVEMAGYPVRFASCEDVIIHKIVAGRAIDEEDVKSILVKQSGKIDLAYVKSRLKKFESTPEFTGTLDKFEKLIGS